MSDSLADLELFACTPSLSCVLKFERTLRMYIPPPLIIFRATNLEQDSFLAAITDALVQEAAITSALVQ